MSSPINNNNIPNNGLTISRDGLEAALTGPMSAGLTLGLCQPIDGFMTRFQTGTSFQEAIKQTFKHPYKGAGINFSKILVGNTVLFAVRPQLLEYAKKITDSPAAQEFWAGLFSGIAKTYVTGPFSTLSVKKITGEKGQSAIAIYKAFPKGQKFKKLYEGLFANKLRESTFLATYFSMLSILNDAAKKYNAGKQALQNDGSINPESIEPGKATKIGLGVLASMISQFPSLPFHVIAQNQRKAKVAQSVYQTAAEIISKGGVLALWKGTLGILPRMGASGAAMSAAMLTAAAMTDRIIKNDD